MLNGTRTHRILRIVLSADDSIARVEKLAEGDPRCDRPTLGTIVKVGFRFNARFDERLHALAAKATAGVG